jgi:hypothetical protein
MMKQWLGAYPATVYNTVDPAGQNRVQLLIPQVLGNAISQWALPLGLVTPSPTPSVGTAVHAMFLGGDPSHPVYSPLTQTPTLFASYDAEVAEDSPVAWWKLNDQVGSDTALDYSGNGYTGTADNVTFGETGAVAGNTSASFDGTNSRIVTAYTAPAFTQFSAEIWLNLNGTEPTVAGALVGTANTGLSGASDTDDGFSIILNVDQYPFVYLGNGSASTSFSLGNQLPSSGWVQLVVTWNGSTVTCYQNGITTSTTIWAGPMGTPVNPVVLGATLGSSPSFWFKGLLAEVSIYNTTLSVSRVLAHYGARTGADVITANNVAATSVTATDIDATTVTVAGTITISQNGLSADDVHYIGQSGQPGFSGGWSNYGHNGANLAFWNTGVADDIRIDGVITPSSDTPNTMFTLPEAYQPNSTQFIVGCNESNGTIAIWQISNTGQVGLTTGQSPGEVYSINGTFSLNI